jgi:mannitol/fructose-specific phosphotransferase system IIA component (Ntr-type)
VGELLAPSQSAGYLSPHSAPETALLLTELLTPDRIRVPISAGDKPGALRELVEFLAAGTGASPDDILPAVMERERVLSTGIGYGIAIPHAKTAAVSQLHLVAGSHPEGVPFEALDGQPVRLFFLLVGPESAAGQHVKALSRIARLVRREAVRGALLEAPSPAAFHQVLVDAEER